MTNKEAIMQLEELKGIGTDYISINMAVEMAIKALEQEPCEDAISREAVLLAIDGVKDNYGGLLDVARMVRKLPPVNPQSKTGHCKDCKYFEYDSVAKVDGIPLIVAHEICNKWGKGCKTREDGFCFLFEPKADMEDEE